MTGKPIKKILPTPEVPEGLREAHLIGGNIVPFVGAGLSKLAGFPSWNEFADSCLRYFVEVGQLNYCEIEQLKHLSPRIKLTLAMRLHKDGQHKIKFEDIFSFTKMPEYQKSPGYNAYSSIQVIANTYVTTNYDDCLRYKRMTGLMRAGDPIGQTAESYERKRIYKKDDIRPNLLSSEDTVIHLHGSAHVPDSMIITTSDYAGHYARDRIRDKENSILTFLTYLFTEKTALFIGYGLEEIEILEFICRGQTNSKKSDPKHYLIQGFLSYELDLANHMHSYYQDLGIELIPFARDQQNWEQIAKVLEDFSKQIPAQPILNIEKRSNMRRLLDDE